MISRSFSHLLAKGAENRNSRIGSMLEVTAEISGSLPMAMSLTTNEGAAGSNPAGRAT
jgi:hypothetical protein